MISVDQAPTDRAVLAGALMLIEQALEFSRDLGGEVASAVERAVEQPLPEDVLHGLATRILVILRNSGVDPTPEDRARLAREVEDEAVKVVQALPSAASSSTSDDSEPDRETTPARIQLVARYGVQPGPVRPVPTFKGVPVAMQEGYVDISTINLWKGNHRVELYVEEFQDTHHREPDDHEVIAILQGEMSLNSLAKGDPFEVVPLAKSIASKGVERPPILTADGEPKDGNRRIAAARYVLSNPKAFSAQEQERARWVKVWVAPPGTSEDQIEAIVIALNFEHDHKQKWEEYVKARLVVGRYRSLRDGMLGRPSPSHDRAIKQQVADFFAIETGDVSRYLNMVRWAEDFDAYHVEDGGKDQALVRHRANDIFQWFYEIQAGRGADKLTHKLDADEDLKKVVYDLMYDVLDSGAEVRNLHKVIADEPSLKLLTQAHEEATTNVGEARKLVTAAIAEAAKNTPTKKVGFQQFLKTAVDRLGGAAPNSWQTVDTDLLKELRRVLPAALGIIAGELESRDVPVAQDLT